MTEPLRLIAYSNLLRTTISDELITNTTQHFLLPRHQNGQQLTETPAKLVARQAVHRAQEARP